MPFRPLHRAPGGATAPYCSDPELHSQVIDRTDICRRSDGFAATLSTHGQRPAFHGLARFSAVRLAPVLAKTSCTTASSRNSGGGLGAIYKAEDGKRGGFVAQKFLPDEIALRVVSGLIDI